MRIIYWKLKEKKTLTKASIRSTLPLNNRVAWCKYFFLCSNYSLHFFLSGICYFHEKGIIRHMFMIQLNVTITDICKYISDIIAIFYTLILSINIAIGSKKDNKPLWLMLMKCHNPFTQPLCWRKHFANQNVFATYLNDRQLC